jgi:hypothetical protein
MNETVSLLEKTTSIAYDGLCADRTIEFQEDIE